MKNIYQKIRKGDVVIQFVVVFVAFPVTLFLYGVNGFGAGFFLPYFIVGAFQLISYLIQLYHGGWKQNRIIKLYSWFMIVYLIGLIPPITMLGLFALLFTSPILALCYPFMNQASYRKQFFFDPNVSIIIENTEIN